MDDLGYHYFGKPLCDLLGSKLPTFFRWGQACEGWGQKKTQDHIAKPYGTMGSPVWGKMTVSISSIIKCQFEVYVDIRWGKLIHENYFEDIISGWKPWNSFGQRCLGDGEWYTNLMQNEHPNFTILPDMSSFGDKCRAIRIWASDTGNGDPMGMGTALDRAWMCF